MWFEGVRIRLVFGVKYLDFDKYMYLCIYVKLKNVFKLIF